MEEMCLETSKNGANTEGSSAKGRALGVLLRTYPLSLSVINMEAEDCFHLSSRECNWIMVQFDEIVP